MMLASDNTLVGFWLSSSKPAVAVLADICQLSMSAVKRALTPMFTAIEYQLIATTIDNNALTKNPATSPLFTLLKQVPLSAFTNGVNFTTTALIAPKIADITASLYPDTAKFYTMLGVLVAKTNILITKLVKLMQWVTTLALAALAGLANFSQSKISEAQFLQWILAQPVLGTHRLDEDLLMVSGFDNQTMLLQRLKSQALRLNQSAMPKPAHLVGLAPLDTLIQDYLTTRPLAIIPGRETPRLMATPIINQNLAPDIFTAPATQRFAVGERLQKHWMATAMLFSAVVFGGIGLMVSRTAPQPAQSSDTQANKTAASQPKYHDVAIVRIASTADSEVTAGASSASTNGATPAKQSTVSETPLSSASDKANSQKATNKDNAKTADKSTTDKKNTDKKATDKKSETQQTPPKRNQKPSDTNKADKNSTAKKSADKKTDDTTTAKKATDKKQGGQTTTNQSDNKKSTAKETSKKDTNQKDANKAKSTTATQKASANKSTNPKDRDKTPKKPPAKPTEDK